jgi:hypothetical protein
LHISSYCSVVHDISTGGRKLAHTSQTIAIATNVDAEFNKQNTTADDIPQGGDTVDNSYASRPDQKQIPVLKDETPVEEPNDARNPNSDVALGKLISIPINPP